MDTLIKLASFKREAPNPDGVLTGTQLEPQSPSSHVQRPSFTIILILFKSFKDKLKRYIEQSKVQNVQYFGMLRNDVVDEIELEPIETAEGYDGSDSIPEGYDEMIYR